MANTKILNKVYDTIYDCKVAIKFTDKRGSVRDLQASETRMFYWLHNMKKREMGDIIDECRANTLEDAVRGIVRAVLSMWGGHWEGRENFLLEFKA